MQGQRYNVALADHHQVHPDGVALLAPSSGVVVQVRVEDEGAPAKGRACAPTGGRGGAGEGDPQEQALAAHVASLEPEDVERVALGLLDHYPITLQQGQLLFTLFIALNIANQERTIQRQ